MRRIVLVLCVGVVVLACAWLIAGLPGHVSADIGAFSFEASTPVAVFAALLAFVLLYAVISLLGGIVRLPRTLRSRRAAGRRRAGDAAVTRTLLALASGEKGDARREASRARRLLGDTPQTLLLVAEAGRLAGRDDEAEAALRALAVREDAAFLGLRGLLRRAIDRQDWTEAAALARQAEEAQPGATWLRQERARLAIRAGNWADALTLVDADMPKAPLRIAAADAEPDPTRALRLARQAWQEDPSLTPAALGYAVRLRGAGREVRAQAAIRQSWGIAPQPALAEFALSQVTERLERMSAAQLLTETNPDHVESRLLLARTALDAGLIGEARRYADAARDSGINQRRLWLLLAEIEEAEGGDTEAGRLAQRDALRHAAGADLDPSWRCDACHTVHTIWHPCCPNCFTVGSIRWSETSSRTVIPATLSLPEG